MSVSTGPGNATVTVIGAPAAVSSEARHSLRASTARFETWYAPWWAPVVKAAIDDVCRSPAGSPWAMRRGTNARTPWYTPCRFTASRSCQFDGGAFPEQPDVLDTGVPGEQAHRRVERERDVGEPLHLVEVGDVGRDAHGAGASGRQLVGPGDGVVTVAVREHDRHAGCGRRAARCRHRSPAPRR